jgi:hypothetical protein
MVSSPILFQIAFDGACIFYHHPQGTDVWFPTDSNHVPVLSGEGLTSLASPGEHEFNLTGWTVHIVHGRSRQPMPPGKVTPPSVDLIPFVDKLMPNTSFAEGLPDVAIGRVPMCLATHVRLGAGSITAGVPDQTEPYATAVWTLKGRDSKPHEQTLISNSQYRTYGLEPPVRIVLRRGMDEQWFEPTIRGGLCFAKIEMRDTKRSHPIHTEETRGVAVLDEFRLLLRCFDSPTLDVPTARIERDMQSVPITSTEALCPQGQAGGGSYS